VQFAPKATRHEIVVNLPACAASMYEVQVLVFDNFPGLDADTSFLAKKTWDKYLISSCVQVSLSLDIPHAYCRKRNESATSTAAKLMHRILHNL